MRSTVRTYINQVAAVDILVNFAWIVPILECFYRWTVILLVSFLSVCLCVQTFPPLIHKITRECMYCSEAFPAEQREWHFSGYNR